jgi:4-hydroxybenzoate polyprenyltransferase
MIASLAGADLETAARLAASMFGLQASIGALNDLVDAPLDAGRKPGKPIPRGLVSARVAGIVAAGTGGAGLALSALSGWATLAAAVAALGLGFAYDLRLSGTRWSWLPLALALPVVPIHAWLGATGSMPPELLPLLPVAVLAGGSLAIANGLVDAERDAASGRRGSVVAMGRLRAWLVQTAGLALAATLAVLLAPDIGAATDGVAGSPHLLGLVRGAGVPIGIALLAVGAAALLARRGSIRERGWELEAVGVAAVGIGWLAGTAAGAVAASAVAASAAAVSAAAGSAAAASAALG